MQVNGPQSTGYVHGPQSLNGPHNARKSQGAQQAARPAADQLDISAAASQAADEADAGIRSDLVARIRDQIADGSYETADKVDAAVSRLLDEIG